MSSAAFTGPSTSENPVLIFDLDGTILSVNSFRLWVMYLLIGRFGLGLVRRAALTARTAAIMAGRKLLRQSHADTKRRLQRLWSEAVAHENHAVAEAGLLAGLKHAVRPMLQPVLALAGGETVDAVLTTAAVSE